MRNNHVTKNIQRVLSVEIISVILIAFGSLTRIVQYWYNRSIWADEAALALNIVNRSYAELTQPLDYEQGAPIGFLILTKMAINLWGNNEYALRLIPLIASIISLFLFYKLARQLLPKSAIPIALALFVSLPHLVYYSSEVKQYSSDVAIALLLFLLLLPLVGKKITNLQVINFSLIGAISIWFSHPAIFVLAGIGLTATIFAFDTKKLEPIKPLLLIFATWLLSFVLCYWLSLSKLTGDEHLVTSWNQAFPSSPLDIIWLLDALGKFFYKPLGFETWMDGLAIVAFLIGCVVCWRRKKATLLLLISPLFTTLVAAYLHKYPFRSRLLLFLTPFFILLIAEGVNYILQKTRNSHQQRLAIVAMFLTALLLWQPMVHTGNLLVQPNWRSEIKPVLSYIRSHQKPGDILYIHHAGIYQFLYYAPKYSYKEGDYILGVDDLDKYDGKGISEQEQIRYINDLKNLPRNTRVWLLFSHRLPEREIFLSYLDQNAIRVSEISSPGTSAYLYDLR